MRRIIILSAAALWLAACSPEAPGGGEAQPPADAPGPAPAPPPEPAQPPEPAPIAMSARGTEPFWRIDVTDAGFKLTRPDAPARTVTGLNADITDSVIKFWSAGPPAVRAIFTKETCSDGMSDLTYPYKVELTWGAETLKGCGFATAAEPREGE